MAEEQAVNVEGLGEVEVKDRGLFDFARKKEEAKEEKPLEEKEQGLVTGVENIHIGEGHKEGEEEKQQKHGLHEKLHRSHSSSSSSSSSSGEEEEEVEGEGGIKQKIKKKKKDLKEKLHGGGKKEEKDEKEAAAVPGEKGEVFEEATSQPPAAAAEEKKGFLDKIKEKLPGHGKKAGEEGGAGSTTAAVVEEPPAAAAAEHVKEEEAAAGNEGKEKKGIFGKIMEKLPGYHKNAGEEGEKSPVNH